MMVKPDVEGQPFKKICVLFHGDRTKDIYPEWQHDFISSFDVCCCHWVNNYEGNHDGKEKRKKRKRENRG